MPAQQQLARVVFVLAAAHARRRAVPEPLGEPGDEVGCLLSTARRGAVPERAP